MTLARNSFTTRFIAMMLAITTPFCCCFLNAAVVASSAPDGAVVVRTCCSHAACMSTEGGEEAPVPEDGRCGCIKLSTTSNSGFADLLTKLELPIVAHVLPAAGSIDVTSDWSGTKSIGASTIPDEDVCNQDRRDLRRRLMLQV